MTMPAIIHQFGGTVDAGPSTKYGVTAFNLSA